MGILFMCEFDARSLFVGFSALIESFAESDIQCQCGR